MTHIAIIGNAEGFLDAAIKKLRDGGYTLLEITEIQDGYELKFTENANAGSILDVKPRRAIYRIDLLRRRPS